MNQHNYDPQDAFVEYLAGEVLIKSFLRNVFPWKLEKITDKFIVGVPALVPLKKVRHEISVADKFHKCKAEVGVADRVDFMEFSSQHKVERHHFISVEIILLTGGITNQIEEEFEERSLMVIFAIFAESFMENIHDGLNGVVQEYVGVIAGYQFVANYYQFWIVFDVGGIHCTVVGTYWEFYLLKGVVERIFKEISDLVLWFVEYLL